MIVDIECPRCRGEGWLLQRAPRLGPGLYEVTCEHCNGHGAVAVDAEDEVDWGRAKRMHPTPITHRIEG